VGGWGCEATVDSSPVAEDGESDEDSELERWALYHVAKAMAKTMI
jgi:hypothetical protein